MTLGVLRRRAWACVLRGRAWAGVLRGPVLAVAAGLTAVCLLVGCSGLGSGTPHPSKRPRLPRGLSQLGGRLGWNAAGSGSGQILAVPITVGGGGEAFAFLGGGTGRGGAGSRPKITVPPVPPANSSLAVSMPLEAYEAVSTQQQEVLAQASNLLTQRCMAAKGFTDTSSASQPFSSVASLEEIEVGGAGLTSMSQARTYGFAQPKGPGNGTANGPAIIGYIGASAFGDSLKAGKAYAEALFGFAAGGSGPGGHKSCSQQASQQVYGGASGEPVADPVPQIAQQSVGFTQSDPRIEAVNRAWSACMARRFYHYASPSQLQASRWPKPPSKAEIRAAVADVKCKTKVNLLNTWLSVEAAYQRALIGRNLTALSQLQANFTPLLQRAQAALAETSAPAGS
jgi:hypothetical protein